MRELVDVHATLFLRDRWGEKDAAATGVVDRVRLHRTPHPAYVLEGDHCHALARIQQLSHLMFDSLELVEGAPSKDLHTLDFLLERKNLHDACEINALSCQLLDPAQ